MTLNQIGGIFDRKKFSGVYNLEDSSLVKQSIGKVVNYQFDKQTPKWWGSAAINQEAFCFSSDGTKAYLLSTDTDRIYQYTALVPFDPSSLVEEFTSIQLSDVTGTPTSFVYSPDGLKMYVCDSSKIYQYTLGVANDFSTLAYVKSANLQAGRSTRQITIDSTGTKLFASTLTDNWIDSYDFGTAWDVATLTYNTTNRFRYIPTGSSNTIQDVTFNPNGTKMYLLTTENRYAVQYNLSSAYDLTTASNSVDILDDNSLLAAVVYGNNGQFVYCMNSFGSVNQWSLATAYRISPATLSTTATSVLQFTGGPASGFIDLKFSSDGTKAYALNTDRFIYQYTLGTAWDISTISYANKRHNLSLSMLTLVGVGFEPLPTSITFKPDGTAMFVLGTANDFVYEYILDTAWDVSTARWGTELSSVTVSAQESLPTDVTFSSDGTRMYVLGDTGNALYQYSLAIPWDVKTASYASKILSLTQDTIPVSFCFNNDGTIGYMLGDLGNSVFQYTFSTAWEINTGSYANKSFSVGSQEVTPNGLAFGDSGTKMYVVGTTGDRIYQYNLTTAWDIATASYSNLSLLISGAETSATSLAFSSDGTKAFVAGTVSDTIRQYNLSTAWNISTGVLQVGSIGTSLDGTASGISFSSDGTKVYYIGTTQTRVFQVYLSTPWSISSASFNRRLSLSGVSTTVEKIEFDPTGLFLYLLQRGPVIGAISRVTLGTAWTVLSGFSSLISRNVGAWLSITPTPAGFAITPDGNRLLFGTTRGYAASLEMTTPWNVGTLKVESLSISSNATAIGFNSNGTVFHSNDGTSDFYSSTCTVAYDLETATFNGASQNANALPGNNGTSFFYDFYINANSDKLQTLSASNKLLIQYDRIGTTVFVGSFSVFVQNTLMTAMCFNTSGTNLYLASASAVYQYNLTTPFDLRTISFYGSYNTTAFDSAIKAIDVTPDDSRVYVAGDTTDAVSELRMTTPGDITTMYYIDNSPLLSSQDTAPADVQFSDDGTKMYVLGSTNARINQYACSIPFDAKTAVFENKIFNLASLDSSILNFAIDPTGLHGFILTGTSLRVNQFKIETAWDISTAYFIKSAGFGAQITGGAHPVFGDNGNKLYVAFQGSITSTVYQYDLTIPYDITTRVYTNKSFTSPDTQVSGIQLNPTGTRLFLLGDAGNRVYQYTLETAWDISTRRTYKTYSVGTQESTLTNLTFKPDGTRMYITGWTNDRIYQYTLSTPYDVTTATYDNKSFALQGLQTGPSDIYFKDDGLRVYVWDIDADRAHEYRLTTPWDISTAYWVKRIQTSAINLLNGSSDGFTFKSDGTKVYLADPGDDVIYQYSLTTAWDINSMVYDNKSFNVGGYETDINGVEFSSDGKYLYIVGTVNDTVYQFECDTYWDVSTARLPYKLFSLSAALGAVNFQMSGGTFSSDGTRFYVISPSSDFLYQYSLSTAWDISTMTYANKSFNIINRETAGTAIEISSDGTKVYILGVTGDTVIQLDLSTAYDISTAVYNGKFKSVTAQDTAPHGFRISSDGTKAAVLGQTNDTIYYYTLSTAWDISTMTYTGQSSSVTTQESIPTGFCYLPEASGSAEGSGWYVVGTNSDRIYRYSSTAAFSSTGFTAIDTSGNFSQINTNVSDIMISPDGNWIYLLGTVVSGNDTLYQLPLLTPYSPSTAVIGYYNVSTQELTPEKVRFSDNGSRMYVMGSSGDDVNKYSLLTPWSVSSAGLVGTTATLTDGTPQGLFVNSDGSQLYTCGTLDIIRRWATSGASGTTVTANGTASVAPTINDPRDIFFSSNGLKMFVLDGASIYEYDVDEAFNIYAVNTQWATLPDTAVRGATWSSDGLKCFTAGDIGNAIFSQNASYAWNLNSLAGASTFINLSTTEFTPRGLFAKPDGSKMYVIGEALDGIREYSMTNYASPLSTTDINIGYETPNPIGLTFSSDGLNAYFIYNNTIHQVSLETAWDVSTAFTASASVPDDTVPIGMFIGDSGTKLFVMGRTNDSVRTYTLTAPWNIGKPTSLRNFTGTSTAEGLPSGLVWSSDGSKFFTVGQGLDEIREWNVPTPWNTSSASYSGKRIECIRTSTPTTIPDPFGLTISDDGTKIITMSGTTMYSLELSTAYDLNSFTHGGIYVAGQDSTPRAICFNGSGTRMYMAGSTNDTLIQYNLASPWRIVSCIAANISRSLLSADGIVRGIDCDPNATKFYVTGIGNNRINEFTNSLSNGDIGTLAFSASSIPIVNYESSVLGLALADSGTKLCIVGSSSDRVFQFSLGTAYNISSWDTRKFSIAAQEPNVRGIALSPDGGKLFVYGTTGSIFQYDIPQLSSVSFSSYSGKFLYAGTLVGGSSTPADISFAHNGLYFYLLDGQANASAFVQRYGLLGF